MKPFLEPSEGMPIEALLESHFQRARRILESIPEGSAVFRYAPEKWSVRELVAHILVAHRIFTTRAMRISRGETQVLTGFDENIYAQEWPSQRIPVDALAHLYRIESEATLAWMRLMSESDRERLGVANGIQLTPNQIFRAIYGHERHHLRILSRYGLEGILANHPE